jgi:hypothetical protein
MVEPQVKVVEVTQAIQVEEPAGHLFIQAEGDQEHQTEIGATKVEAVAEVEEVMLDGLIL